MKRPLKIPPLDLIKGDTPLSLAVAAAIAFPDGTMSVIGLRAEYKAGRLELEEIAGKTYVTLDAIKEMRTLCRSLAEPGQRPQILGSQSGRIAQARARAALDALKHTFAQQAKERREKAQKEREAARLERLRTHPDRPQTRGKRS